MKKHLQSCMLILSCLVLCLSAGAEEPGRKAVNTAAAVRSLDRAAGFLSSGNWSDASFEARLGATFDPEMADFPYIEALCLAVQGAPRADILERVHASLSDGLSWRSYNRNEALVLCARLKAETCDYQGALSTLGRLKDYTGADGDYVRLLASYGLGKTGDARAIAARALERWPFDPRFPKAYLQREASLTPDDKSLRLAATILSRLYIWENEDRDLLLLAVPFESDPAQRDRYIRTYRNMGTRDRFDGTPFVPDPSSALLALEYGILDEDAAATEILTNEKTGIRIRDLEKLCRITGSATVRARISAKLDSYEGVLIDDANGDCIDDSWVRYRLGRPFRAEFDPDQDGYPDYTVDCDLGSPATITDENGGIITYDTYPDVRSVKTGNREYTMKPLALKWAPVTWILKDFRLEGKDFFVIGMTSREPTLTERLLVGASSFYIERNETDPDIETRVTLESGIPLSSEKRDNGRAFEWTSYYRGFPSSSACDRDGDGYFETRMQYSKTGKLASVLVDRNANRTVEYREQYGADGTVTLQWDSDENGVFEISQETERNGNVRTRWIHPVSGENVVVSLERGEPRSVSYGSLSMPVIKDPVENVWWISRIPPDSRTFVKKILAAFNPEDPSVVTDTIYVDGKRICAVRTGGLLFAELLDE